MYFRRILLVLAACQLWAFPAHSQSAIRSCGASLDVAPLNPGDVVRVRIWREPDMSGDFPVDDAGTLVVPRLGPVDVRRETPESLKAKLTEGYLQFLSHASVDVTVMRRVQVLGAVREPGLYPMDATMTVGDALALAGGTTPQGNPRKLQLIRGGERFSVRIDGNTPLAESPVRSCDQIYVPERSWVSRNTGVALGLVTSVASLIITLTR